MLKQLASLEITFPDMPLEQVFATNHALPGLETVGPGGKHPSLLTLGQGHLQGNRYVLGNVVLYGKNIFYLPVITFAPGVKTGRCVYQLGGYANSILRFSHASLEHVSNTLFPADAACVDNLPLVGKGRSARDDKQVIDFRQRRDDILGNTITEKVLLRDTAQVGEWQYRNRWLVGNIQNPMSSRRFFDGL